MKTLYIDTHSNKIAMGIFFDGVLVKIYEETPIHQNSARLAPILIAVLDSVSLSIHDVSDIIVINGPGSFTGIRLGVTMAKTLAKTLNIPIRIMSSILIKAISNEEKGHHWFVEEEKNGYYVGEFNDLDELLGEYIYIKKVDYATFKESRDVIENVSLNFDLIYAYSRLLPPLNPHLVNPLYVKMIEVQK
ncbi:MAG: tRNA (adenosine(37)-N6)-threonylcarbamoyltransferase complex dimerization subunit type 1 TsaB [Bacilli bacterium]|jgi:tRNA threonylcarbamoyl adenosine modification protein YeaZ|nr:tRNA (adenosine(37)-N6)-threonylcarbamoyltransferase complex dimerization subunit type 1 TsaB [Bacilli bacterium]